MSYTLAQPAGPLEVRRLPALPARVPDERRGTAVEGPGRGGWARHGAGEGRLPEGWWRAARRRPRGRGWSGNAHDDAW